MKNTSTLKLGAFLLIICAMVLVTQQALLGLQQSEFSQWSKLKDLQRSFDGSNNHLQRKDWGKIMNRYDRMADANFANDVGDARQGPNARLISNILADIPQGTALQNDQSGYSMLFTIFGQFVDHDSARTSDEKADSKEQFIDIPLPEDDPRIGQITGNEIPFARSRWRDNCAQTRTIINGETPYLDLSTIYGYNEAKSKNTFRSGSEGKLLVNANDIFPQASAADPLSQFIVADGRVNTNYILFAIHVMFHRLHNNITDEIIDNIPEGETLSDDEIFTIARNINIGIYQHIVIDEFVEHLIGGISPYEGYDFERKPEEYLEVNTAGFRYGHSMLVNRLQNLAEGSNEGRNIDSLKGGKFKQDAEWTRKMIRGSAKTPTKARGLGIVDGLRDKVSIREGKTSLFDVLAFDIQRGRDHGIPTYTGMRDDFDLEQMTDFSGFGDNAQLISDAYQGEINDVDLIIGIMAEPKIQGSVLGAVGSEILNVHFQRIREADRHWYQREASHPQDLVYPQSVIDQIQTVSLGDVIQNVIPNIDVTDGFIIE